MKLTSIELACLRAQGLYVTEKCDGCGKLLNQSVRYTITGKPEVYCSAVCRDLAFFRDRREARKHSTPGRCTYCGATLKGKRRGARYCDEIRKKRAARAERGRSTAQPQITGTPTQLNQQVARAKNGRQGDCITSRAQPLRTAPGEVCTESGLPVEVGRAVSGSRNS